MRNYYPLEQYLTCANQDTVILSFEEIGKIIGDELPQSALKYHAWWSSPSSHPHAYSWHNAGYKVSVNLIEKKAVFTKSIASSEKRIKSSPFPKTLVKKAPAKAEKPCPIINSATKHINISRKTII